MGRTGSVEEGGGRLNDRRRRVRVKVEMRGGDVCVAVDIGRWRAWGSAGSGTTQGIERGGRERGVGRDGSVVLREGSERVCGRECGRETRGEMTQL